MSEPNRPRPWGEMSDGAMFACQLLLGTLIAGLWQWGAGRVFDVFFLSSPAAILQRLWQWVSTGSIFAHLWATLYATLAGFFIGSAIGLLMGIWLGRSKFMHRLLDPYLSALNALPKVALAPLFVLWFGIGIESKIALAAMLVLFLVFLNTYTGVQEVDQDLIDTARLMKATKRQVLTKVIIPSAASWVFASLKISVPYALIGAVLGEMIAANRGLGYLVQFSGAQFDTAGVFAALVVISLVAVFMNWIVDLFQRRAERWRVVGR